MYRILRFRNELLMLWRAFMAPGTPLWLKGLMLIVPLYLVSPLDLIPDVIPIAGFLDDIVIIPLLVTWLVGLVAQHSMQKARATSRASGTGTVIDGTARRL